MKRHEDELEQPLEELSPLLRRAVEAVREQPVPASAVNVALRKADHVQHRNFNRRLMLLMAACFLAAFGVALWATQQHLSGPNSVAVGDEMTLPTGHYLEHAEEAKTASPYSETVNDDYFLRDQRSVKTKGPTKITRLEAKSAQPGDASGWGPGRPGEVPMDHGLRIISAPRAEVHTFPARPPVVPMTGPIPAHTPGPVPKTEPAKDSPVASGKDGEKGESLKKLRDLAQNAKDGDAKRAAEAALIKFEIDYQTAQDRNEKLVARLGEITNELNKVVRDQKIVRSVTEYKKRAEEGRVELGDVEKLVKEIDEQIKAGAEGKEQVALLALKAQLEDQVEGMRTDQHEKFIPNPFLRAKDNPLSTFSIDVDTASYSLTRRYLKEQNQLPPRDAVRIEEMVNYFDYNYPQPRGDQPISVTPEVSACPWNKDHRLVRIAVQGRKVDPSNLPPRNLVFLIDVSGSMSSPDRLPLVKQSLGFLIDQLTAKDKVAIVVYAGQVGTALESTAGSEKETIRQAVEKLGAGGSTNGAGGIMAAYEEAHKNFIPGGVNRVILATDGDFNVGISSQGELVRLIEEKRNKGIFLTALGYGMGNLKDSTIMKLADHGHGHYAYIDSLAEAKKIFVEEGAALITLAKDVKIQVEFNPKTVAAYKLIGYEKRLMAAQDFNDDTKLAGVMGCGHRVTALYEVVPAGKPVEVPPVDDLRYQQPAKLTPEADSGEILTVKVRYKEPLGDKSQLILAPVKDKGEAFDKASTDFRFAAAVAAFAILLRDNPKDAGINLAGVAELAESARGDDARGLRKEFVELVKKADQLARQPKPANN